MRQTMDQKRAKHAWEMIARALALENKEDRKSFGKEAKRLGPRIMAAGLGHAIAFLQKKQADSLLHQGISSWIAIQNWSGESSGNSNQDITKMIIEKDSDFLRLATDETMSLLAWVVRFAVAEGLLDEKNNNQDSVAQEATE
jgi:CRISPR type III-B/RAMP module-associated protein Cmr5